ncbi:MAG: copper chaperone PCu(A)C [Acidimicrobiia bacterium]
MSKIAVAVAACALFLGACSGTASLEVTDARISLPAGPNAAVYFELVNNGDHEAELVGAESDIAIAEIHQTTMSGGMMQMTPVDQITVAPGQTVEFAPGGLHVMLMDVPALELGQKVEVTLAFSDGQRVTFDAEVSPIEIP